MELQNGGFQTRICKHVAKVENPCILVVNQVIKLTEKEEALFLKLKTVVEHFKLKTILRVAGGWVRDRLLNRESTDIDIVLDNCTGVFFAQKLVTHFQLNCNIGVTRQNSEKCKHLETASLKLDEFELDFVNLRTEEYTKDDSRVPTMEFGSANKDAFRRDFTINSLFYNITTNTLEDFTGRGMKDLEFGRIETPLSSIQTFKDDPLRMLRAIRFAQRLNFQISDEICEAAQTIVPFLTSKVTNSRIGDEIDNYLTSLHPEVALDLLVSHGLCSAVFKPIGFEKFNWHICLQIFKQFKVNYKGFEEIVDQESRIAIFYSAFLFPFFYLDTNMLRIIVLCGLLRSTRIYDKITLICKVSSKFHHVLNTNLNDMREQIGLILCEVKDFWQVSLHLALASLISSRKFSKDSETYIRMMTDRVAVLNSSIKTVWLLDKVWKRKVLNGNDLKTALKIEDPKLMSRAVLLEQRYNYLHTLGIDKEEDKRKVIAFIKKEFYAYILLDGITLNQICVEENSSYVFQLSSNEIIFMTFLKFLDKCKDKVFIVATKDKDKGEQVKKLLNEKAIYLLKTMFIQ